MLKEEVSLLLLLLLLKLAFMKGLFWILFSGSLLLIVEKVLILLILLLLLLFDLIWKRLLLFWVWNIFLKFEFWFWPLFILLLKLKGLNVLPVLFPIVLFLSLEPIILFLLSKEGFFLLKNSWNELILVSFFLSNAFKFEFWLNKVLLLLLNILLLA